jgi:hypothetical protein
MKKPKRSREGQKAPPTAKKDVRRPSGGGFGGLQRAVGNQAVVRLLREGAPGAPVMGEPGDRWEREAHRIADLAKSPVGQRGLGVGKRPLGGAARASGSGTPLADEVRGPLESRLGYDLSDVSVHTGAADGEAARSINARAFTVGKDVFLGEGASPRDLPLMAHEVAHVVQQHEAARVGAPAPRIQRQELAPESGGQTEKLRREVLTAKRLGLHAGPREEEKKEEGLLSTLPAAERTFHLLKFEEEEFHTGPGFDYRFEVEAEFKARLKPTGSERQLSTGHEKNLEIQQELESEDFGKGAIKFNSHPKEGGSLAAEFELGDLFGGAVQTKFEPTFHFDWHNPLTLAAKFVIPIAQEKKHGKLEAKSLSLFGGLEHLEGELEITVAAHVRPNLKFIGENAVRAAGSSGAPYALAGGVTLAYFAWAYEGLAAIGRANKEGREQATAVIFYRAYADALADLTEIRTHHGYVDVDWRAELKDALEAYDRAGVGPDAQKAISKIETAARAEALQMATGNGTRRREDWAEQVRDLLGSSREGRFSAFYDALLERGLDPQQEIRMFIGEGEVRIA